MSYDDEIKQIDRDYRLGLFLAFILCGLGFVWGVLKIFFVYLKMSGV